MMTYTPQPIDTDTIKVSRELEKLIEQLARHVHDTWAKQRIAAGWRYGPQRDDAALQHPDLVPYEQLPESEKIFDRNTASETIKVLLQLGYRIEKRDQNDSADNKMEA